MTFVRVGDTLQASLQDSPTPSITLTVQQSSRQQEQLTQDTNNLVHKAATLATTSFPTAFARKAIRLHLIKRLPVASGMGGGSSDAAATLTALCALAHLDRQETSWHTIARQLGADVPFFWHGQSAIACGIGDILYPMPSLPAFYALLVTPATPIKTPAVFQHLGLTPLPPQELAPYDAPQQKPTEINPHLWQDAHTCIQTLKQKRNDLYPAARQFCPTIDTVLDALNDTKGCLLARLSGSGATCFALYLHKQDARNAHATISQAYPQCWCAWAQLHHNAHHTPHP